MEITWCVTEPDSMFDALIELHKMGENNVILELRKDMIGYCKLYCYSCNQHYFYNKYMNHALYCKKIT